MVDIVKRYSWSYVSAIHTEGEILCVFVRAYVFAPMFHIGQSLIFSSSPRLQLSSRLDKAAFTMFT